MVKRVSSSNKRKFRVRPRNVKRRIKEKEKATAEMQAVLGRSKPKPETPAEESA